MPVGEASMMPSRGSKVLFGPVRSRRTGAHDRGVELHLPEEVLQHVVLVDVVLLHALLGVRALLLDFGLPLRWHRALFVLALVMTATIFVTVWTWRWY